MDGSEKEKTTTVGQYDADEIIKQAKQMCMTVRTRRGARRRRPRGLVTTRARPPRPQICIVSFINYKWGSPMPLLFQCVMQPMALFEQPLFQIHILGKEAKDDLARPFKAPANPLQEMMGGARAAGEHTGTPPLLRDPICLLYTSPSPRD